MTATAVYRRPSSQRLSQGDIAIAEVVQLRSTSGSEGRGPGLPDAASPSLPYYGAFEDFQYETVGTGGGSERRIVRLWTTLSMVLSQSCEIEWADDADSRLTIAPIVTKAQWPEGPWEHFARNPPPGYVYLPPLDTEEAAGFGLPEPWPESVVCLAGASASSKRLVKPRRALSLSVSEIPRLQDAIARFFGVRGFADVAALDVTQGKAIQKVVETGQMISGPSSLVKIYFGNPEGASDADDELTVAYWGVRPSRR